MFKVHDLVFDVRYGKGVVKEKINDVQMGGCECKPELIEVEKIIVYFKDCRRVRYYLDGRQNRDDFAPILLTEHQAKIRYAEHFFNGETHGY